MAKFFIRSETDEHDRQLIGVYTNDCWEIRLCDIVKMGGKIAVRPVAHHILTRETSQLLRDIMTWAEPFQDSKYGDAWGNMNFDAIWNGMPLEHSVAKEVVYTSPATLALHDARIFLQELPRDLGRGSWNGMALQLAHKVDEALR